MFAQEEEWGDGPEEEALSRAVGHSGPRSGTAPKVCGMKRSLLRTLRTLGSIPSWTQNTVVEDSDDSEPQAALKHRKKKGRKRKKAAGADGEAGGERTQDVVLEDTGSAVSKKAKKNEEKAPGGTIQLKMQKPVGDSEKKDSQHDINCKEGEGDRKLSRLQWKNKMKNKRRCKNKYRQNGKQESSAPKGDASPQETGSVKPNEEADQVQNQKNKTKQPKQDRNANHKKVKRKEKEAMNTEPDSKKTCQKNLTSQHSMHKIKKKVTDESKCKGLSPEENTLNEKGVKMDADFTESKRQEGRKQRRAKVEKLRRMLQSKAAPADEKRDDDDDDHGGKEEWVKEEAAATDRSATLKAQMEQRLEAARFRYINEQLYTSSSKDAMRLFKQDPQAFSIYHQGFTTQVQHWPVNPVDAIIAYIKCKPASLVVADFGCGDCKIARSIKNKVHSFDLAPICDLVTVCDMAKVPLPSASVDIAVFCLSLMGTNLADFLAEANRVLVMGGILKIAEVASRFENVRSFLSALANLGFKSVSKDTENNYFYSFEFVKADNTPERVRKAGLELKPCVYKKR